jgi:ferritin-like metal-binding protein YciE
MRVNPSPEKSRPPCTRLVVEVQPAPGGHCRELEQPMGVHTLKDVFRHALGMLYDAEQQIFASIDEIETETRSTAFRNRIRQHRSETQRQIQNLERCFELLGTDATRAQSAVARAMREDKRAFRREQPSPDALEIFDLDAASKTEHYEIASYRSLLDMAVALGVDDVRRLLEQNLREEESMSEWLTENGPQILAEVQGDQARVRPALVVSR